MRGSTSVNAMIGIFRDIDAVLFDLDGTLVETNIDFTLMKREMVRLAARHGVDEAEVSALDILAIIDRTVHHLRERKQEERAEAAQKEALDMLEQIELRYSSGAKAILGAHELVAALRERGVAVGIVTRNCRTASLESLEKTGIRADVLLCREDVQRAKPSPDQLLQALSMLGAGPDRAVMVGDHIMDILAGKAAGMRTVAILTPGRPRDFFDSVGPEAIANNLGEIISAVVDHHR